MEAVMCPSVSESLPLPTHLYLQMFTMASHWSVHINSQHKTFTRSNPSMGGGGAHEVQPLAEALALGGRWPMEAAKSVFFRNATSEKV